MHHITTHLRSECPYFYYAQLAWTMWHAASVLRALTRGTISGATIEGRDGIIICDALMSYGFACTGVLPNLCTQTITISQPSVVLSGWHVAHPHAARAALGFRCLERPALMR